MYLYVKLIQSTSIIIWDEVTMVEKRAFDQALNHTMQDVLCN